jgi:hypothetical protein
MQSKSLIFALFAAALLFSTLREWSAPIACPRLASRVHRPVI